MFVAFKNPCGVPAHSPSLNTVDGSGHVEDRVLRSDLVEMDFFRRGTVDVGFGLGQPAIGAA